jgi:predicted flap endonuclease-1-like 5' DNA nuclease
VWRTIQATSSRPFFADPATDASRGRRARANDGAHRGWFATVSFDIDRRIVTPSERNALLFFSAVALLGAGVRLHRSSGGDSPLSPAARDALERQIVEVDEARERARSGRAERSARSKSSAPSAPSALSVPLDLDTAPAESLERLPRIGPALARRIIADRDSLGAFGSLEEFQRVKGVGPAMARALGSYVTFSGTPRPSPVGARVSTRRRVSPRDARDARVPP